jgi:hypothetical protein
MQALNDDINGMEELPPAPRVVPQLLEPLAADVDVVRTTS